MKNMLSFREKKLISNKQIEEHNYHLRTRGYSLIPSFLEHEECQLLKESLSLQLDEFKPISGSERSFLDKNQLHDLINRDLNFARLLEDPRLHQAISPHLGEHWIMYAATSSSIPPKGTNYSARLHVDSPRFSPGYVFNLGVIWSLDEYTNDNGALELLPGSHHDPTEPSLELFEKNKVKVLCEAGTLIVFNARVFHRTGINTTDKWRHSMTLNACRSFMKQRMDWVRFIPPSISEKLNKQARRLIGFDTRLPSSLSEFFVPETERLYKSNQG